jgi:hypothetical protein
MPLFSPLYIVFDRCLHERDVNGEKRLSMFRKITFNADEELIRKAQEKAASEQTSLNELFRVLMQYVNDETPAREFDALMLSMDHVRSGRTFSREEMNGR